MPRGNGRYRLWNCMISLSRELCTEIHSLNLVTIIDIGDMDVDRSSVFSIILVSLDFLKFLPFLIWWKTLITQLLEACLTLASCESEIRDSFTILTG
uniref:Uncharacterized protein n=1 Tax=Cannabis sativa TaxID=3483 RepID=A0A803RA32_CANSA